VGVVRLRGNRAAALDAGGALLATAEAAGGCLELHPAGGRPVRRPVEYLRGQKSLVRPPMAQRLALQTAQGRLELRQSCRRTFTLLLEGVAVGALRGLLFPCQRLWADTERLPEGWLPAAYALCLLLFREDWVELV
ncbi:MAG TPA: hypothetical protein H9736_08775, partial [Candidatus Anaerotruncus excrementipullorum]|nr:hypothetical protein [Candidatus Anaerotruncus excrementipullorum]